MNKELSIKELDEKIKEVKSGMKIYYFYVKIIFISLGGIIIFSAIDYLFLNANSVIGLIVILPICLMLIFIAEINKIDRLELHNLRRTRDEYLKKLKR